MYMAFYQYGCFVAIASLRALRVLFAVLDFRALGRVGGKKGAPIVLMMLLHFVGP